MSITTSINAQGEIAKSQPSFLQMLGNHPTGFWFIFWGEFAERCSFYGMRAILAVYMADTLGFGKGNAGMYFSFFTGACYLLPLVGGWVADNYFGKFNTIVWFSLPYILGHVVLGFENPICLFIALLLLAMGAGVTKPNISTLMGLTYDQKRPGQDSLRTQAFSIFYMSINIGAAISQFSIPPIKEAYGYWVAFLFPAALMAVAFVFFAAGKRFYAVEKIERKSFSVEDRADMKRVLRKICPVFLTVMFFWSIFDQSASTWIFFGDMYQNDLYLPLIGKITPERIQFFNPVFIVLFLPLVAYIWSALEKRNIRVKPTTKLMAGFFLTGMCMLIMAYPGFTSGPLETPYVVLSASSEAAAKKQIEEKLPAWRDAVNVITAAANPQAGPQIVATSACHSYAGKKIYVQEQNRTSLWWQGLIYLILTIAEILISVTGLEMAFVVAPQRMKGFVTSLWLLTVFLANTFLNAPLSQIYPSMQPGSYFLMLSGMMAFVMLVFYFIARDYNRMVALEGNHHSQSGSALGEGEGIVE
jgi:POT family proton-dependent oligopeptide transporter